MNPLTNDPLIVYTLLVSFQNTFIFKTLLYKPLPASFSFSFSKPLPLPLPPQSKMKMNLLLLFLAAMVVRAISQPPNPFPLPYDYYSVVFQWAKSVCNTGVNQCIKPTFPAFTLHGLWPQRYRFPPLHDCRRNLGYTNFKNASVL